MTDREEPQRIGKRRRDRGPVERLERAIRQAPGEDPVFVALLHSFERYLAGKPAASPAEAAVREGLERNPQVTPEYMRTWVDLWHQTPESVKERFTPPELRALSVDTPIDAQVFERVCARAFVLSPIIAAPVLWRHQEVVALPPIAMLGEAATITGTVPGGIDGEPVAQLGRTFTLVGSGFSTTNSNNTVVIYRLVNGVPTSAITSHPVSSTPTALTCVAPLPNSTSPGLHKLQVSVSGRQPSNVLNIWLSQPIGAGATILNVSPPTQYPGKKIMLTVQGFGQQPTVWWRSSSSNPQDSAMFSPQAVQLNPTQIEAEIPTSLVRSPGSYWVAVSGANQALSNWAPVNVAPYKYKITFIDMTCLDESDPEWWGDDEIVTRWVVVADDVAWSKGTGEYSGFSDGTQKNYRAGDRDVFVPDDGPGEVRSLLSVGTLLLEWDAGDAEEWNSVLTGVADVASLIPKYGTIVSAVLKALGKLISWFGGDPDDLGTQVETWTAEELLQQTWVTGSTNKTLLFMNDDDTGSYRLTYNLQRIPA